VQEISRQMILELLGGGGGGGGESTGDSSKRTY